MSRQTTQTRVTPRHGDLSEDSTSAESARGGQSSTFALMSLRDDQTLAERDQTSADADQTRSDDDQIGRASCRERV